MPLVTKVCAVCGSGYAVHRYRAESSKYCSIACYRIGSRGYAPHNKGAGMGPKERLIAERERRKRWREANRDAERAAHLERKKTPEGRIRSRMDAHVRRLRKMAASDGTVPACDPIGPQTIAALFDQQYGVCFWTGDPLGDKFEVDHIVPISKGGAHSTDNLCLATVWANRSKSDLMPDVFWARLWDVAHVEL